MARVTLHRIRLPFKTPFKTAKATLTHRESIIVEVTDHAGRTGLGECVAFPTDWYLPETLDQDARILHDVLAPIVLREAFLHPSEASAAFAAVPEAKRFRWHAARSSLRCGTCTARSSASRYGS